MPHIVEIDVTTVRNVSDLKIRLDPVKDQSYSHLILTGPNGSGKTGILEAIKASIQASIAGQTKPQLLARIEAYQRSIARQPQLANHYTRQIEQVNDILVGHGLALTWSSNENEVGKSFRDGESLFVFFDALRNVKVKKVQGPAKSEKTAPSNPDPALAEHLLQTCVNKKTEQAYAQLENDMTIVRAIDDWFSELLTHLRKLFGEDKLRMEFERKQFDFRLIRGDGYEFSFQKLSHGFASTLHLLSELLLRREMMRESRSPDFEPSGVVIIDEIETHLHLRLQEIILPFITNQFPNLQFIVATHSVPVVASVPDALVVDLGSREQVPSADFIGKRYGTLMTSHFGVSSDLDVESTAELEQLRKLVSQGELQPEDLMQRDKLAERLSAKSHALAVEVWSMLNLLGDKK